MATDVTVRVCGPGPTARAAVDRAEAVFARVEAACTRFDPTSPLMRANADPGAWHQVPDECFVAIAEAARAHRETGGLFDPRVLEVLQAWGYDRTLPFHDRAVVVPVPGRAGGGKHLRRPQQEHPVARGPWRPGLDTRRSAVRLGRHPVDLGGIGKGLAVRWAAAELAGTATAALVEAGGDCYAAGPGPEGTGWRVAVEDPRGGADPVAVLQVSDRGVATSSVKVRRWQVGDREVHHLVDPRTGRSGGAGLLAVTVVADDAAWAEVWSKTLFLTGRGGLRTLAESRGLAALWVDDDGVVGTSRDLAPYLLWQAPRAW
jgi:thiamine biosynthesis lipoprotein